MYTQLLIILGLICGGMLHLSESQNTTCPNTCILQARCNPYSKNLVWTVLDNVCRVFQNGCIFGNENCMRANQCLPPMIRTTREHCMAFCPRMCYRNWPPVCGWFPYTNSNGTTGEHYRTFGTRCFLNLYACQNAEAYVNEPRTGPCP
nr:salivary glue protein Sgs-5 [Drosophila bipectinata]